jgi:hypothetical protein
VNEKNVTYHIKRLKLKSHNHLSRGRKGIWQNVIDRIYQNYFLIGNVRAYSSQDEVNLYLKINALT